jgi:predicted DNA-binding transcriptional regulator AlpA
MKQIYTYNDICKIVNKSRPCLYQLVKRGKFPEPDIILNSRLKYYSRELLEKSLADVFKIDLNKYEESNITDDKQDIL